MIRPRACKPVRHGSFLCLSVTSDALGPLGLVTSNQTCTWVGHQSEDTPGEICHRKGEGSFKLEHIKYPRPSVRASFFPTINTCIFLRLCRPWAFETICWSHTIMVFASWQGLFFALVLPVLLTHSHLSSRSHLRWTYASSTAHYFADLYSSEAAVQSLVGRLLNGNGHRLRCCYACRVCIGL